jgi:hypothetical protein
VWWREDDGIPDLVCSVFLGRKKGLFTTPSGGNLSRMLEMLARQMQLGAGAVAFRDVVYLILGIIWKRDEAADLEILREQLGLWITNKVANCRLSEAPQSQLTEWIYTEWRRARRDVIGREAFSAGSGQGP